MLSLHYINKYIRKDDFMLREQRYEVFYEFFGSKERKERKESLIL